MVIWWHLFYSQLYSFLSPDGTYIARFNSSGTRLLVCDENGSSQLVVYDLPTRHRTTSTGKVLASLFSNKEDVGGDACCFAGLDDDLVIGGSDDHNLFIWSLPDGNRSIDCTINRSLRVLTGHGDTVNSIRCSSDKSFIVSCADDGVIKLWTASRWISIWYCAI